MEELNIEKKNNYKTKNVIKTETNNVIKMKHVVISQNARKTSYETKNETKNELLSPGFWIFYAAACEERALSHIQTQT